MTSVIAESCSLAEIPVTGSSSGRGWWAPREYEEWVRDGAAR
jgi:hypothetical protein